MSETRGTSADSALARLLQRRPPTTIRWGLERVRKMLHELGDPHRRFRSVHVGGTNGKGTTAACLASVLCETGLKVGLYTSPHLVEFSERIRVNGRPVPDPVLEEEARPVLELAERHDATFFEAATVLAFLVFAREGVEAAVVEVGLGGRLDATNILLPELCVVTGVAYDHAEYLGSSLRAIATEKAGILKKDVPAILGPGVLPVLEVFERTASRLGAPLTILGRDAHVDSVEADLRGTRFTYRSPRRPDGARLVVPLVGRHQATNAALAVLALEAWAPPPGPEVVAAGFGSVAWPGRFQLFEARGGPWVLDVAHNAEAAAVLAAALHDVRPHRPLVGLIAILGDKQWKEMLAPLLGVCDAAIFTVAPSAPGERRWDPHAVRRVLADPRVEVEGDFCRALARARELAGEGTVVVTGSCHTVGDALRHLGREDPDRVALGGDESSTDGRGWRSHAV